MFLLFSENTIEANPLVNFFNSLANMENQLNVYGQAYNRLWVGSYILVVHIEIC